MSEPERARLDALLEALPSAAALFAPSGMIVAINRPGRALFAYDEAMPAAARHWSAVLRPLGSVADGVMAAAAAGRSFEQGGVPVSAHGMIVDVRVSPIDDTLWLVSAVEAAGADPSRVALEQADRELATLFDLTPSSVRFVDRHGTIRRRNANAGGEHAAPEPVTVRELWERDAPRTVANDLPLPFAESPASRAFAGSVVRGLLLDVRRQGGVRTIEAYAAPLRDAAGQIVGVMLLDRDVLAAQEARARERRLAATGQLAAGILHDLNNALNPIMAAAYLLRQQAESPDAVRDYADRITAAAETGAATAARLARFIRQQPTRDPGEAVVDLADLASDVLDQLAPGQVHHNGGAAPVRVVRDLAIGVRTRGLADDLRDALRHLIDNALAAMPVGGTLTIRTAVEGADARLVVADTGLGMTADTRDRAFEPFFTTKGTMALGLGLAEVYGIARRHRGTVLLSSEPGRGTEVVLRLPLDDGTAFPAAAGAAPDGLNFNARVTND